MATKQTKSRKIGAILGIATATLIVGAGAGVGTGYLLWKANQPINNGGDGEMTTPVINLVKTTGNEVLANEGDTVTYELQSSVPLHNYTGSYANISEGYDAYIDWYDPESGTPATPTQSGIFWNDANDISQGITIKLYLIANYDANTIYSELSITAGLHDNNEKYADVTTSTHVALVNDDPAPISTVTNDYVANIDSNDITTSSTLADVITKCGAANESITGSVTLSDEFFTNNLNAAQVAALIMLDALQIKKHSIGIQVWDTYDNSISTVNWTYTSRIKYVAAASSIPGSPNSFNVLFEQDVKNGADELVSPTWNDQKAKSQSGGANDIEIDIDMPSCTYTAINAKVINLFSGYSTNSSNLPKFANADYTNSTSLHENSNTLVGNLNSLWFLPVYQKGNLASRLQTDFTVQDLAEAFWPNATFN